MCHTQLLRVRQHWRCRASRDSNIYPIFYLQNYTQNIDTLETAAGVQNVLQCHGSFATASCLQCRRTVHGKAIEADILRRKVPLCTVCNVAPPDTGKRSKKHRKKATSEWDSDDEDESDGPDYPPGIMKASAWFISRFLYGLCLVSLISHSLGRSFPTNSNDCSKRTDWKLTCF